MVDFTYNTTFDSISWSIHNLKFTNYPVDSIDTGQYILSIIKHLSEKNVIAAFDSEIVSLRKTLLHFVLHNSVKMTDFCIICGLEDDEQDEDEDNELIPWLECEICKRWSHEKCLKSSVFNKQFACIICQQK